MSTTAAISELCKKTLRFGPLIALGNVILTQGRNTFPPTVIKRLSDARNQAIQRRLSPLVDKALANYRPYVSVAKNEETIWVCWLQGEEKMPPIPAMCLESIRKNSNGRTVQVVTLDNYTDFVQIDPRITELYRKGKIKNCHFADILRVNLLAQRGGLWMDATLYCASPINELFFSKPFHTIHIAPYGNFVSQCRWAVYCLSCKPGNKLFSVLEILFADYLSSESLFIDYFLFDQFIDLLYQKDAEIRQMIDDVPMNNPRIFALADILTDSFEPTNWERYIADTELFKLNWKKYGKDALSAAPAGSFYSYLKSKAR